LHMPSHTYTRVGEWREAIATNIPAADAASTAGAGSGAPHATDNLTYAYPRVGEWRESIATNIRSADAASTEGSVGEALHANDYLMYAYLQTGQDSAAARVLAALPALAARYDPNGPTTGAPPAAAYFAMAAIPARYALERGDWSAATKLEVHQTAFPFADAITWFARGIGAART